MSVVRSYLFFVRLKQQINPKVKKMNVQNILREAEHVPVRKDKEEQANWDALLAIVDASIESISVRF